MTSSLFAVGVIVGVLLCVLNVPCVWAQKPGWINIDCGSAAPYVDPITGIDWVPDAGYISTGINFPNVPGIDGTWLQNWSEYRSLRYFPDSRAKNCYTLSTVTPNTTYILRATFFYGSYDNAGTYPSFQLAIEATVVYNVTFSSPGQSFSREFTLMARKDTIFLCLTRDNTQSVPFVSSITLRPYPLVAGLFGADGHLSSGQYFHLKARLNLGGYMFVRYPDDAYDRFWSPEQPNSYFGTSAFLKQTLTPIQVITTNQTIVQDTIGAQNPNVVMQTAVTTTGNLTITFPNDPFDHLAYLNVYFAELDPTANTSTSRQFGVQVDTFTDTPVDPFKDGKGLYKASGWLYSDWQYKANFSSVVLHPYNGTKLGPLLNALEFYRVTNVTASRTIDRDALAIEDIKSSLYLSDWTGDPCLPYPHDWVTCSVVSVQESPQILGLNLSNYNLTGTIPTSIANLSALTSLSLDNNALTGPIPVLSALTSLKILNLANNNLTGTIPGWLASLPSLIELYVQNNDLSGPIPATIFTKKNLDFKYNGNLNLFNASAPITSPATGSSKIGIIVGTTVGGITALVLIILLIVFFVRRTNHNGSETQAQFHEETKPKHLGLEEYAREGSIQNQGAKAYSLAEVIGATDNFKNQIGRGGFGSVYYGKLADTKEVAVKVSANNSRQGASEFFNEVDLLSRVHHKNLVSLVGYCQEDNKQILIYEYMHKGSLRDHLHGGSTANGKFLDWKTRLNIALDASQGLEYLHSGCNPNVIHRDIKSSNILLTNNMAAKVADFGLSKLLLLEGGVTHISTDVKGTAGYLDPEYFSTQSLTTKSDVFSFGVVLLEMLTGRIPIDPSLPNPNICDWVRSNLQGGNIEDILDPAVKASHPNLEGVWKVAEIGVQSVEPKAIHRPPMSDVVQELRAAISMEGGPTPLSFYSHPLSGDNSQVAYTSDASANTRDFDLKGSDSLNIMDMSGPTPR